MAFLEDKCYVEAGVQSEFESTLIDFNNIANDIESFKNYGYYDYMTASEAGSNFFSLFECQSKEEKEKNCLYLKQSYEKECLNIIEHLGNDTYTDEEKILNYLEYIRLCGMYENYSLSNYELENPEADKDYLYRKKAFYPSISQCRYNIALFGKGVCYSQSRFLADLLANSNLLKSEYQRVFSFVTPGGNVELHEICGMDKENSSLEDEDYCTITLDPTIYDGTIKSMKTGFSYGFSKNNIIQEIDFDEEDILKARKRVLDYCSKKYDMKNLLIELGIHDGLSDDEKLKLILEYLENNIVSLEYYISVCSVEYQNREFEIGKLFELLCYSSGLKYKMISNGKRSNTIYNVKIEDKNIKIDFIEFLSNQKANRGKSDNIYVKKLSEYV